MSRIVRVGAAQMGPVARRESRRAVVDRLIALMRQAADAACDLVVFPELALTTFFPRWLIEDDEEIDSWFEDEMPGAETKRLFDEAGKLGIAFHLGYAERARENGGVHRYNTSVLVDSSGGIIGKYRKVHLPGTAEPISDNPGQHLEKRYFEVGNLGFPVFPAFGGLIGMCICNDRRWPETYRVMGLQGADMIVLGYNTPVGLDAEPPEATVLAPFHNHLVMQAGAYQNACWVVGVAKAGHEEGYDMIGQSAIIAPSGEIVAMCRTLADELVAHDCDLDAGKHSRDTVFNFTAHRRTEHYGLIVERTGVGPRIAPP